MGEDEQKETERLLELEKKRKKEKQKATERLLELEKQKDDEVEMLTVTDALVIENVDAKDRLKSNNTEKNEEELEDRANDEGNEEDAREASNELKFSNDTEIGE